MLDVWFFKTGSDVCYLSFADALQADWLIRNAQITWLKRNEQKIETRRANNCYATSKKLKRDEQKIVMRRAKNWNATSKKLKRDEQKIVMRRAKNCYATSKKLLRDEVDMSLLVHRSIYIYLHNLSNEGKLSQRKARYCIAQDANDPKTAEKTC